MGEFDSYLKRKTIKHPFIYPRCPKINAYNDEANRTLQEEFIDNNEEYLIEGIVEFNDRFMDYLAYNTTKVHQSLNNVSPIEYLLKFYLVRLVWRWVVQWLG